MAFKSVFFFLFFFFSSSLFLLLLFRSFLLFLLFFSPPFQLVNPLTLEVGIASVTCVTSLDLRELLPVVVVGKGGGACQSSADPDGTRRPIIFSGLKNATHPATILQQLSAISGHDSRQYGIVDALERAVTFSGARTSVG